MDWFLESKPRDNTSLFFNKSQICDSLCEIEPRNHEKGVKTGDFLLKLRYKMANIYGNRRARVRASVEKPDF